MDLHLLLPSQNVLLRLFCWWLYLISVAFSFIYILSLLAYYTTQYIAVKYAWAFDVQFAQIRLLGFRNVQGTARSLCSGRLPAVVYPRISFLYDVASAATMSMSIPLVWKFS